jgi:2-polyprenyl-3-methyl-5-hydroxy-6-metoxy-1,4-benzoquinol methylase
MDLREVHGDEAYAKGPRHPWELTRFAFFQKLLRRTHRLRSDVQILDVGSGDAWFSGQLAKHNELPQITCWDLNYSPDSHEILGIDEGALRLCSERPEAKFDLILMMDVLEHVEDDIEFLRETVKKNLRPGGSLLISVPAWKHLISRHDRWLHHFRRYLPSEFHDVLAAADLQAIKKGGLFHSLLLPRSLRVLKERLTAPPPLREEPTLQWQAGSLATTLVSSALRADNWISHRAADIGLPLPGLSVWALCQQQS